MYLLFSTPVRNREFHDRERRVASRSSAASITNNGNNVVWSLADEIMSLLSVGVSAAGGGGKPWADAVQR